MCRSCSLHRSPCKWRIHTNVHRYTSLEIHRGAACSLTSGSRLAHHRPTIQRDGEEALPVLVSKVRASVKSSSLLRVSTWTADREDRFSSAIQSRMSRTFHPPPPHPMPLSHPSYPSPASPDFRRHSVSFHSPSTTSLRSDYCPLPPPPPISSSHVRTYGSLADLAESQFEVNPFMIQRLRTFTGARPYSTMLSPSTTIMEEQSPRHHPPSPSFASSAQMYHAN